MEQCNNLWKFRKLLQFYFTFLVYEMRTQKINISNLLTPSMAPKIINFHNLLYIV